MTRAGNQPKLFDTSATLSEGLVYRPDFITESEEEVLLAMLEKLPLSRMRYEIRDIGESVLTKRRATWFSTRSGEALPRWLEPLRARIAKWLDVSKKRLTSALVNEYTPGTGIGWHRDNEDIEHVVGISLGGWCTMRWRPYAVEKKSDIIALELEPRSAYIMQKEIRWRWQHSVMPTKTRRFSITFRTLPQTTARSG